MAETQAEVKNDNEMEVSNQVGVLSVRKVAAK